MPKASFKFPNGTVVTIDGTEEELKRLLALYGGSGKTPPSPPSKRKSTRRITQGPEETPPTGPADLAAIVTHVKSCNEVEAIEKNILDRSSQIDRTLLPLYIVHEYMNNAIGLTSGEIGKVTRELGIPISTPNCSKTLSGIASKYVIGDKVRKKGMPVRYKLSRRGVQYMKGVISTQTNER